MVRVEVLVLTSAVTAFVFGASFGASFRREFHVFSGSNGTGQRLQPVSLDTVVSTTQSLPPVSLQTAAPLSSVGSIQRVASTTTRFSPPVSSLQKFQTVTSPPPGHVSALPTVVSNVTGPWRPQAGLRKHPCIPATGTVVARPGVHYFSSELEREWVSKPHHLGICKTARQERQALKLWVDYTTEIFEKAPGRPYREPSPAEGQVLSVFAAGNGELQYIEPLHGTARHPTMCEYLTNEHGNQGRRHRLPILFDIRYLIPANLCGRPGPRPRAKLYDLGCSDNKGRGAISINWRNYSYMHEVGYRPSLPLFRSMYLDRCVDFDDIYGWEARRMPEDEWFDPIPDDLRHKVHFFNIPVHENGCPQSPSGNFMRKGSFLRFLQTSASEEDFVVVKVDMDGGPELEIMESIAHRYELSRLVDEVYFEYHFDFDNLDFGWGRQNWRGKTVDTALNLMYRLRQAGIRSHFWI